MRTTLATLGLIALTALVLAPPSQALALPAASDVPDAADVPAPDLAGAVAVDVSWVVPFTVNAATCTVTFALASVGPTAAFGFAQVADTSTFVGASAGPTGAFAGGTTYYTLLLVSEALAFDVNGVLAAALGEGGVILVYVGAQAPPTIVYAGATLGNSLDYAGAMTPITVAYVNCVLSGLP